MTFLKCWNSGVESNGAAFILSPSECGLVVRVLGAYGKEVASSIAPCLARQRFVGNSTSDNLLHDRSEPLPVREAASVIAERLFIDIPKQMKWLHADIGSVQTALQET